MRAATLYRLARSLGSARKIALPILGAAVALAGSRPAAADLLDFQLHGPPGGGPYDYATETWSSTMSVGAGSVDDTGGLVATDLSGEYLVDMQIDHSGNVLGGVFTLIADSSPTLGITSPEILLSGNLLAGGSSIGTGVSFLDTSITYVDPLLASLAGGPINSAELGFVDGPCWQPDTSCILWSGVQNDNPGFNEAEIFATFVPEPSTFPLIAIGLGSVSLMLGAARRRHNRQHADRARLEQRAELCGG